MKNKGNLFALLIVLFSVSLTSCGGDTPAPSHTPRTDKYNQLNDITDSEDDTGIKMPYLIGMDFDAASEEFPYLSLVAEYEMSNEYKRNQIIEQNVSVGRDITEGQQVEVLVSSGSERIELEDYEGGNLHVEDVSGLIVRQGLPLPRIMYEQNDEVPMGYVIRTEPPAGTMIEVDEQIVLWVSIGEESDMTFVPDMIGLTRYNAERQAEMYDIVIIFIDENSDDVEAGRVMRQELEPMTSVEKMTEVEVYISTGPRLTRSGSIRLALSEGRTGFFRFDYFIDGVLQPDLSKIHSIETLNNEILWEFEGTGVKRYAIYLTSVETGKSGLFCEYEFDFTGLLVTSEQLSLNTNIFTELSSTDTEDNANVPEPEADDNSSDNSAEEE